MKYLAAAGKNVSEGTSAYVIAISKEERDDPINRTRHARRTQELRYALDHECGGDVSEQPDLPGAVQPLDRELVYRPIDSLHVPRIRPAGRLCGHLCLRAARSQLRAFVIHGCDRRAGRLEE